MVIYCFCNRNKEDKEKLNYLTIKRIALGLQENSSVHTIFLLNGPILDWIKKYYDLESEWDNNYFHHYVVSYSDELYKLTDFLVYNYNIDKSRFMLLLGQIIKQGINRNLIGSLHIRYINNLFSSLGLAYSEGIVYQIGHEQEAINKEIIKNFLENKLNKIDPELSSLFSNMQEELASNSKEKTRNLSNQGRTIINLLLEKLTPGLVLKSKEENKIVKRLKVIFPEEELNEVVSRIGSLITSLQQLQCKATHSFSNEETALFTFEITNLIVYLILSNIEK